MCGRGTPALGPQVCRRWHVTVTGLAAAWSVTLGWPSQKEPNPIQSHTPHTPAPPTPPTPPHPHTPHTPHTNTPTQFPPKGPQVTSRSTT